MPTVRPLRQLLTTIVLLLGLLAPAVYAQREKLPSEDLEYVEKNWPEAKKTVTGLRYIVMREGQGELIKPGDKVDVCYIGRLLRGKIFEQVLDHQHPLSFRVRRYEVIEGWDQILQLMKRGEKRLVIIPSEMAYGSRGNPPIIPRDATLVFEMEVIAVNGK